MNIIYSFGPFIIVLGVLIFVHEAGHFLAAKAVGIYVYRFSFGWGSPIKWLTFRRGETEYCVSWLPLGGYVKMATAEEGGALDSIEGGAVPSPAVPYERTFEAKPLWQRLIVLLAGVTMNALFAFGIYTAVAAKVGEPLDTVTTVGRVDSTVLPAGAASFAALRTGDRIVRIGDKPVASWSDVAFGLRDYAADTIPVALADGRVLVARIHPDALEERMRLATAIEPLREPVIGQVVAGTPAAAAGVQPGDTVLAIDSVPVRQWSELVALIEPKAGVPIRVEVGRAGGRHTVPVTPAPQEVKDSAGRLRRVGQIGIGYKVEFERRPYTAGGAIRAGWEATTGTVSQMVRTLRGLVTGRVSRSAVGGPILIGQMAAQSARMGLETFLEFMALISVNLAVINLLPVPLLDGGTVLLLLVEGALRRKLPPRMRAAVLNAGALVIVCLIVFSFWNDIRRLLTG